MWRGWGPCRVCCNRRFSWPDPCEACLPPEGPSDGPLGWACPHPHAGSWSAWEIRVPASGLLANGLHDGVVGGGEGSLKAGLGGEVERDANPPGALSHNCLLLVTRGRGRGRILENAGGGSGRGTHGPCCWGPGLMVSFCSSPPQSNKVPVVQHPHHVHPLTPLITYSNEHFTPGNPPPHLPADVDPKTGRPCAGCHLGRVGGLRTGWEAVVEGLLCLSWVWNRKVSGAARAR